MPTTWDDVPDVSPKSQWDAIPDAPEPVPQPYLERVAHGEAIKNAFEEEFAKPYSQRLKEWSAAQYKGGSNLGRDLSVLGAFASFGASLPEMVASGVKAGYDALTGQILTGPGLRREDFTDEPATSWHAAQPLDTLIQRAQDMAMSGGVGESSVPRVTLESRTPLLLQKDGTTVRPFTDAEGTVRGQTVGTTPSPADFENAATVIAGKPSDAVESQLRQKWREEGQHPSEVAHDAQGDLFLRHDLTTEQAPPLKLDPAEEEVLTRTGGPLSPDMKVAATDPPVVPLDVLPAQPPGRITAGLKNLNDKMFEIIHDGQMMLTPMARGAMEAQAMAKDYANMKRWIQYDKSRQFDDLTTRFTPEELKEMWNANDEESVMRQTDEVNPNKGHGRLNPDQLAVVEEWNTKLRAAWEQMLDRNMVKGEGLPAYTPRMALNVAAAVSGDKELALGAIKPGVWTKAANLKHRKYLTVEETEAAMKKVLGDKAEVTRDFRVMPLVHARLQEAIAGRDLINSMKEYGQRTGDEVVSEGGKPVGSEHEWENLSGHPAGRIWEPKYELNADGSTRLEGNMAKIEKDKQGNDIYVQRPTFVRSDFAGPIKAVTEGPITNKVYQSLMSLKAKSMSLIMFSPMIHLMVEYGRAFPAMPIRIFKANFDGRRVLNNPEAMREWIVDGGIVPIGKRFFNQDINSILEDPSLTPGRSWTAKVLGETIGRLPQKGMTTEEVMNQVRSDVDKMGDFYHNTLLWDRIAELQMGLAHNLREDLLAKGVDRLTSTRVAGHFANRFAGSLPQEAMSRGATAAANLIMFSRTFTLGNLGVMKDALTGLPRDVMAQITRDAGQLDPAAAGYAKALARRKAFATITADIGLFYIANAIMQNAFSIMASNSSYSDAIDKEMQGYARRFKTLMAQAEMHPLELLSPMTIAGAVYGGAIGGPVGAAVGAIGGTVFGASGRLIPSYENEPGKKDRVHVGYTKDGTGIYMRSTFGKIGEEFLGYMNSPLGMALRKLGTLARPILQTMSNDKGFGHHITDPTAETPMENAQSIWEIIKHFTKAQLPEGQINAVGNLIRGEGDTKLNLLQTFGPFAGLTFSKGFPGSPAEGEIYAKKAHDDYQFDMAKPDLVKMIGRGEIEEARKRMTAINVPIRTQTQFILNSQTPSRRLGSRTTREMVRTMTPEQLDRFNRAMEQSRQQGPLAPPEQ